MPGKKEEEKEIAVQENTPEEPIDNQPPKDIVDLLGKAMAGGKDTKVTHQLMASFLSGQFGPTPPDPEAVKALAPVIAKDSDNKLAFYKERIEKEDKQSEREFLLAKSVNRFVFSFVGISILFSFYMIYAGRPEGWSILTFFGGVISGFGVKEFMDRRFHK